MKLHVLVLLPLLMTGCNAPSNAALKNRTLWTKEGCAYVVTNVGAAYYEVVLHRVADADKPTCLNSEAQP